MRLLHLLACTIWLAFAGANELYARQVTTDSIPTETKTSADEVTVSLLTCSPGPLIYELYGHTALRVREGKQGAQSDWVFNYGTFSFKQPHFIWRFMLGQTDYELSVLPYSLFYNAYMNEGRAIYEQRLNLTQTEAHKLVNALSENLQPENAQYRYNFFYDNCVTRAVKIIESSVSGRVVWPQQSKDSVRTLRDIVHEFSNRSPWDRLGQDLLVGAEADKPATVEEQMFAPLYASRFVGGAQIVSADGTQRPLAQPPVTLLPAQSSPSTHVPNPLWVFGTLLALTLALTLYEGLRKRYWWQYDALLLIAQGVAGCIVAFLFFFSEHPAVGSNWLVILFNPLPLLYFPWVMKQAVNGRICRAIYLQAFLLVCALVIGICGLQSFPPEVYLIILILGLRVFAHLTYSRHALKDAHTAPAQS